MKKIIATVLVLMLTTLSLCWGIPLPGTKIDEVKYTDIKVYINNIQIPAVNIGGSTAVFLNDLRSYGFDTSWSEKDKVICIMRNEKKAFTPIKVTADKKLPIGTAVGDVKYSQIKTYIVSDLYYKYIPSFNINGNTAIYIDELKSFGSLLWSSAERSVRLKLGEAEPSTTLPVRIKVAERFTAKNIGSLHLQEVKASRIEYNRRTKKIEIKEESILGADKGKESYAYNYASSDDERIVLGRVIQSVIYYDSQMEINTDYEKHKTYTVLQGTIDKFLHLENKYVEAEIRGLAEEWKANNYEPLKFTKVWITYNSDQIPQGRIEVKNLTQKTADTFEFHIYCYDSTGHMVKHRIYDTNRYSALYQSADSSEYIEPGKIKGGDFYWTMHGYEKTAKIKVKLTAVHFTDGTIWRAK